jgi:hypothetical protein
MKKNKRNYAIGALASFCLLLQGCSPNEEELWGLGSFVFLAFVAILILNGIVPRIQEVPKFKAFVAKVEAFSEKSLPVVLLIAIASIGYGAYSITANEARTRQDLFVFVGAVILYMAVNLKGWSRTKEILEKRNHVRAIGLSLSFLIIFAYLLLGAPNLRL